MSEPYSLMISDLHLSARTPALNAAFLKFIKEAHGAERLYILGDLFEYWIGDDCADSAQQEIMAALKKLGEHGTQVFILHGNRDFLLGRHFLQATGATFLADETVINLYGRRMLLMHGDTLCRLDTRYQRYRKIVHQSLLQKMFLNLPRPWRQHLADNIRTRSRHDMKPIEADNPIHNVTRRAVEEAMQAHHVNFLIHGHTHKLGIHYHPGERMRFVLGDWHGEVSCYLKFSTETIQFIL